MIKFTKKSIIMFFAVSAVMVSFVLFWNGDIRTQAGSGPKGDGETPPIAGTSVDRFMRNFDALNAYFAEDPENRARFIAAAIEGAPQNPPEEGHESRAPDGQWNLAGVTEDSCASAGCVNSTYVACGASASGGCNWYSWGAQ